MYYKVCLLPVVVFSVAMYSAVAWSSATCEYLRYDWNVIQQKAVNFKTVSKPYSQLSAAERGVVPGCTVCRRDQVEIHLPGLKPFLFCRRFAGELEGVLLDLLDQGVRLFDIKGYQVGRTRGNLDVAGNRTGFSNHSYGVAIDINPMQNGLYGQCKEFSPRCRLLRGGPWRSGLPGSLRSDGPVVRAMTTMGFKWGGRIEGNQKDFMHFSPTGY